MDEKEYGEFIAWLGKAFETDDQAKIEAMLDSMTDEETDEVIAEWYKYKNNIIKAKKGMKCPNGMIPNYLKIGGKISQCGCKKPKIKLDKTTLDKLNAEIHKMGGKIKKTKKMNKGKKMPKRANWLDTP